MKQLSLKCKFLLYGMVYCCMHLSTFAQDAGRYKIISYNVENLFDTVASNKYRDKDFTPTGKFEWNTQRYKAKLNNLSKVVDAVCDSTPLLFLGVCEVENKKVVKHWLKNPLMAKHHLGSIHFNSMDPRGISVALLYNKKLFTPKAKEAIHPRFDLDTSYKARNILYVKGNFGKEEIHVFLNHWSTRKGGAEKSDSRRVETAKLLRKKIDEIQAANTNAKIIVMGDFNDPPFAKSISEVLNAKQSELTLKENSLFNLMSESALRGKYTFDFAGEQDMLDQIIVSENFVNNNCRLCIDKKRGYVFQPKWLMYKSSKFGPMPFRTYEGFKYVGGFSDHLPVYCDLIVK